MLEKEHPEEYEVKVFEPAGLGFGGGDISVVEQLKKGELNVESLRAAIEIVKTDPEVFVPVDKDADDDGCGDGRKTSRIYRLLDPITRKIEVFKKSRRRAKLFGGGLIVSSSMWRAVEGLPQSGQTLAGDREFLADELAKRGVKFGAHTDTHAKDGKCGCGAIDNYETISRNVGIYLDDIVLMLKKLYGDDYEANSEAISDVLQMYLRMNDAYFVGVTGEQTMKFIESRGAIIKELKGDHKEGMVVLNDEEGTTLDQAALRSKLEEQGLSTDIQAFVVDVWRGKMYADLVADIADERGINRDTAYKRAYADFLIRTLATSATLTKGDQPVLHRAKKSEMALAA